MADKKISQLTNITGADVVDSTDELAIVDASTNETKAITREELFKSVGGATFNGSVSLGDNDQILLGASSDLTIEHNATNGVITNNTNHFYLANKANDKDVYIQTDDGSGGITNYFVADGSTGEAKMYYYGSEKLNTQSGGVDITGTVTPDSLEVITDNNTQQGNVKLGRTSTQHIDFHGGSSGNFMTSVSTSGTPKPLYLRVNTDATNTDFKFETSGNLDIPGSISIVSIDPFIKLTDTSTGVDHEIDANSGVGNLVINADINAEGSDPKLLLKVTGTTGITVRDTGNVDIAGALSKGSGSFKIDHPLKPESHHLVHSFVEAPQADNIYRGKVALVGGSATVNLDNAGRMTEGTFVALNGNIQCFTSNEDGWTAIRGSVSGNTLTIQAQDASCTDTVSWLVIGERHDQHMLDTDWTDEAGRVITEPEKQTEEGE